MRGMVGVLAAVATAAGAAGCGGTASPDAPTPERDAEHLLAPAMLGPSQAWYATSNLDGQAGSGGRAVAYHTGMRRITADEAVRRAPDSLLWRTSYGSWEPTIGVTKAGTVIFDARNANTDPGVARSRDGGRTWQAAGSPEHHVSLDPYLWVDTATGRTFNSDIDPTITCTPISFSDDEGTTWSTTRGCGLGDHQSIFGGPPPAGGAKPSGYPNVVYFCAVAKGATTVAPTDAECLRTLDGGRSWAAAGDPAYPPRVTEEGRCEGFHGHGWVGPDGTAYLPAGWCGKPHLAISHDEGMTWTQVQVAERPADSHEAGIAADWAGNLYYVWVSEGRPYLVISRDGGRTWGRPMDINPPDVARMDSFAASIDVGDRPGRIAVVFMGTADPKPSETTPWNAYVISSVDALDADPTFYASTINDPATNALWKGSSCCGNVGDFIDLAIGPEGTAWAGLVDACPDDDQCIEDTTITTPRGQGVVGQVVGGPPLVGTAADQAPSIALPPSTEVSTPASAAPSSQRRACRSRRAFLIHLREPRRGRLVAARIYVNGRRVKTLTGRRLRARVRLTGLPKGRYRVRIVVRTSAGRTFSRSRWYRTCTPKRTRRA